MLSDTDRSEVEQCCHQGCDQAPVRTVEFHSVALRGLTFVRSYCDEHADAILRDKMVFPGAREVADAS